MFRGFGFTELLAQGGGLNGPGTIEKCMNGSDVKMGIRLYKRPFEAISGIEIRELEVSILPESDPRSSLLVQVQRLRDSLRYETVYNLVNNNLIDCFSSSREGDRAFWLDYFL